MSSLLASSISHFYLLVARWRGIEQALRGIRLGLLASHAHLAEEIEGLEQARDLVVLYPRLAFIHEFPMKLLLHAQLLLHLLI